METRECWRSSELPFRLTLWMTMTRSIGELRGGCRKERICLNASCLRAIWKTIHPVLNGFTFSNLANLNLLLGAFQKTNSTNSSALPVVGLVLWRRNRGVTIDYFAFSTKRIETLWCDWHHCQGSFCLQSFVLRGFSRTRKRSGGREARPLRSTSGKKVVVTHGHAGEYPGPSSSKWHFCCLQASLSHICTPDIRSHTRLSTRISDAFSRSHPTQGWELQGGKGQRRKIRKNRP